MPAALSSQVFICYHHFSFSIVSSVAIGIPIPFLLEKGWGNSFEIL